LVGLEVSSFTVRVTPSSKAWATLLTFQNTLFPFIFRFHIDLKLSEKFINVNTCPKATQDQTPAGGDLQEVVFKPPRVVVPNTGYILEPSRSFIKIGRTGLTLRISVDYSWMDLGIFPSFQVIPMVGQD
jgi:hypothetical protein